MSLEIGYPLYGAALADEGRILVTGGGGEGNNGVPNKVSLVSIGSGVEGQIKLVAETELKGKNDSPTAVVYSEGDIFLACNASGAEIKAGKNKHLRKFKLDEENTSIKSVDAVDIAKFKDPQDYIKVTKLSNDGKTLLLVTSSTPSVIHLVDVETLKTKETIKLEGKEEVLDVALSDNKLAYITQRKLFVILHDEKDEHEKVLKYDYFSPSYQLAKLEITPIGSFLVGVNLANKSGILLLEAIIIPNEGDEIMAKVGTRVRIKIRKARVVINKPAKVTSITIQGELIALSTNLNSIIISDLPTFKNYKTLEKVHSFAITSVKITKDLKHVVSVSVAGTLSVYVIPDNLKVDYYKYVPFFVIILLSVLFFKVNNYVQREYKDQVNVVFQVMFGEDLITEDSSLSSETTPIVVSTGYAVKEGDIVEEVIESKSDIDEAQKDVESEIDESFNAGTSLI